MTLKYRSKGKAKRLKRIALAIKGFTGTMGASAIVMEHPYWGLVILAVGAIANEITNFIDTGENESEPAA